MLKRALLLLTGMSLVVGLSSVALAGIPDPDQSYIDCGQRANVSCLVCPAGDGDRLDHCRLFGGGTTDASVDVYVRDAFGTALYLVPAADIWIGTVSNSCGFPPPAGVPGHPLMIQCCTGGCSADLSTDQNGHTVFSNFLNAGCCGCQVAVYINGTAINQVCTAYKFNSPDLNCSGIVNLSDVVVFAGVYYGTYNYCADFYWDGILNLSDIVLLAQHVSHQCP